MDQCWLYVYNLILYYRFEKSGKKIHFCMDLFTIYFHHTDTNSHNTIIIELAKCVNSMFLLLGKNGIVFISFGFCLMNDYVQM